MSVTDTPRDTQVDDDRNALNATRDALLEQMERYRKGEVDAASCGQVGFLGMATAYTVAVHHKIARQAA